MKIDYSRDDLLTDFAKEILRDRYMLPEEKSPQDAFARAAKAFADDEEHAQRLYDYASKLWFMFSTPILSNGGTTRGLPISCFLNYVPDSRTGLAAHYEENIFLSSVGGGIGGYWGAIRSQGESTSIGNKTTGVIPFMHVADSQMLAFNQGATRRGSYAAYIDISHPEVEEFLIMRKPTGGDVNRKNLNLHHGVNVTDDFMQAVVHGEEWPLVDPNSKKVTKVVDARELWHRILEIRYETGEPYLHFIDTSNRYMPEPLKEKGLRINNSNLCVAGDTKILTKGRGYVEIKDVVDRMECVWTGFEWSKVVPIKTNEDAELMDVEFSNGSKLSCTPYHRFFVQNEYGKPAVVKRANELVVGDKLAKWELPMVDDNDSHFAKAYANGFFTGDGTIGGDYAVFHLYGEKKNLIDRLKRDLPDLKGSGVDQASGRQTYTVRLQQVLPKYLVPMGGWCSLSSKLEWLAGLLDADGCVAVNQGNQSLQLVSTNRKFLTDLQFMLQEIGCESKVVDASPARTALLPDGKGGRAEYECKQAWRILIPSNQVQYLLGLGLNTSRLRLVPHQPNRDARQFVKVTKITRTGSRGPTYCFTEPLRGSGMFNGVMAGNCSEIYLPTAEDRTAVCCLSSVNLEKYDEWGTDMLFIEDLMRMLDNVLTYFIEHAPAPLWRAVASAKAERSVGLGAMGWHAWLQKNGIPFESPVAVGQVHQIHKSMFIKAHMASKKLASERGEAPDMAGTGLRFAHMFAVAPNASSSIICGTTSPSIEPWRANAFAQKTLSGSFLVRNPYLEEALLGYEEYKADVEGFWSAVYGNKGSVQHVEWLSDAHKEVFKTATEIDQHWVIEHAVARQQYIDQGQSVNLFFPEGCDKSYINSVHLNAWKGQLKGLYYLRSEAVKRAETVSKKVERVIRPDFAEEQTCLSCEG